VAGATAEEAAMVRALAASKQRLLAASAEHSQLESSVKARIGDRAGIKGSWGQVREAKPPLDLLRRTGWRGGL